MKKNKKIILLIISLIISLISFWNLKEYLEINRDIKLQITLLNKKDMNFQIFYTQDVDKPFNEIESFRDKILGKNEFQKLVLELKDVENLKKLRIDLGEAPGEIKIKEIKIIGDKKIFISPKDLIKFSKNHIEKEEVNKDTIILQSNQIDPYIILNNDLIENKKNKEFDILQSITLISIIFFGVFKLLEYADKKRNFLSWNKLLYIVLFFIILLLPVIKIDSEKIDKIENRNLSLKSKLIKGKLLNMNYGKETESWLNDHFYKRREIINFYEKINAILIGRIENERALVGKEGWIFYKGDNSIKNFQNINLFTEIQLKNIEDNLKNREEWLKKQNIKYYTFIAPDKNKIYKEYYPDYINQINLFGKGYQLREYLRNKNINLIYPYEELIKEKKENLVYWKTDTHWNEYGGYIGYKRLIDEIKKDFPEIKAVEEEELNIGFAPYGGDLLGMLNINFDTYKNIKYKTMRLKNQKFSYIKNEDLNGVLTKSSKKYKVLIFRDSFILSMTPYISETFGEVEYIWRHDFNNFQNKIKEFKPDIVIHEIVERYIGVLENNLPKLEEEI
ncbi:MAG: alginate O-acetyltransferase AlgX-related protein [Cetobacterium sp.]|uniref:alginate O-acetyltransferase AlgX-related protein n=1 Tax=Cetobacterium sp. TaxID=2071632 RepID=UPI003F2A0523